jgi:hypothetical protein
MAQGIGGFVKQNASVGGALGVGLGAVEIATAENKLKGVASAIASIVAWKPMLAATLVGVFSSAGKAIQSVVKESGSLDLALKRIGKAAENAGQAYENATKKMKEAAGAPWAEREIRDTKNMTAAVEAITPAIGRASASWASLTGGMQQAKSEVVRMAAESGLLGGAIDAVSTAAKVLLPILSALSAVSLAKWFIGLSGAIANSAKGIPAFAAGFSRLTGGIVSVGAASKVAGVGMKILGFAARAVPWALAIYGAVQAAAAIINWGTKSKRAAEEAQGIYKVSTMVNVAMDAQISQVVTLSDKYQALADALAAAREANRQYQDSVSQNKPAVVQEAAKAAVVEANKRVSAAAKAKEFLGMQPTIEKEGREKAFRQTREQIELSNATPEQRESILTRMTAEAAERSRTAEASASEYTKRAASEDVREQKIARYKDKSEDKDLTQKERDKYKIAHDLQVAGRDRLGISGLQDEAKRQRELSHSERMESYNLSNQSSQAGREIGRANQEAAINQQIAESKQIGFDLAMQEIGAQQALLAIEIQRKDISDAARQAAIDKVALLGKQGVELTRSHESEMRGVAASRATSAVTGAGYGVERQKAGIERQRLVAELNAAPPGEAKVKAQAALEAHDAGEREAGVAGLQKGRGIRSELEQSSARVRGDSAAITAGVNFDEFKSKMDSMRGDVGTQKAAEIAGNLSRDAITLRARSDMNSSNAGVASASMARIGGGGGIGPGATSMIDISKQIKDLSVEANKYLFQMLELEKKKGGIPAR